MSKLFFKIKKFLKSLLERKKKVDDISITKTQMNLERYAIIFSYNLYRSCKSLDIKNFFKCLPPTTCKDLRNKQLKELEILIAIKKCFDDNNINYWISDGTLIGAVRNKGFIPWDDDIDISMLEEDYFSNIKILSQAMNDNNMILYEYYDYNGRGVFKGIKVFSKKTQDCFVDIFLYKSMPEYSDKISTEYDKIVEEFKNNSLKWNSRTSIFLNNKYSELFNKINNIWPIKDNFNAIFWSPYNYNNGAGLDIKKCKYEKNWVFPLKEITFEGHIFKCPNNPIKVLERLFGDIYELPDDIYSHFHS